MLEIDPDKLFEDKTVAEVEVVQRKIQDEVEKKKEELRTMVGERYRDLIEAADTISSMQLTAAGVINRVHAMGELCSTLQQRQLLGFQLDLTRSSYSTLSKQDSFAVGTAVQVKVLVLVPEQIWIAMEKQDYLLGTQLFLLARHIRTGFRLENTPFLEALMPVIARQWASISHFQDKLVGESLSALASTDITPQCAARCLCVLALLDNLSGQALLERFLEVRKKALCSILSQENDKGNVKHRVADSLSFLLHTFTLFHACFVEGRGGLQQGLVWQNLLVLTQDDPQSEKSHGMHILSVLDLLDLLSLEPATMRFLPAVTRDFRPSVKGCKESLSIQAVQEHMGEWIESVHSYLKDALVSLLDLVTSIRALQVVRETALKEQMKSTGWDIALQKLQLPCGLDIWASFYQPLLSHRVYALIELQWSTALATLRQKLADQLRALLRDKTQQPEHDLRWLVWREHPYDLPQQSSQVNTSHVHGLLLKCQGYSHRIEGLCKSLDSPLSVLLQELTTFVSDSDVDRNELQQHLQHCSSNHLKEFCHHIENDCLSGAAGREEACVTLVARLLGALCDLNPSVKSCFLPLTMMNCNSKISACPSVAWSDMVNVLQASSKKAWSVWQELVSSRLCSVLIETMLPQSGNLAAMLLHSTPQWDEHKMEEGGEEEGRLQSVIRVPVQPSLALQHVLAEACQVLGSAQPHTVPSDIRIAFIERLVGDTLRQYHSAVKPDLAQSMAIQFLHDVKFLMSLLIPRSQRALSSQAQQVCLQLEEKIDPFDLDVFSPFIQKNVRQSVRHMQCLFGVLISCWPEKLANIWTNANAEKHSSCSSDQASMLAVCPPVPWFPLLPIVQCSTVTGLTQPQFSTEKPQIKQQNNARSPKKKVEPMENIKSGAAAFFEAMSTDWFG